MTKLILTFALLILSFNSVSAQTLDNDLRKHFNKFKVIKMNNQEALRKARLKLPFKIQPADKELQFILRQNDIRSADYRAEYTDRDGKHNLPRSEVSTYKAKIIGERNSVVALTVDGTKFEGYLATETESFFIESAKNYSRLATDEDKIIYNNKDRIVRDDTICGLGESFQKTVNNLLSDGTYNAVSNSSTGKRVM